MYNFSQIYKVVLEKKSDFIVFAIFSNSGHLGFWTKLNFVIQKPCSVVMQHVKI